MTKENLVQALQNQASSLKEIANELENLESEIHSLVAEKETINTKLEELENAKENLAKEIANKDAKIEELQNEIERLSQNLQEKELELTQLRTEHAMQEQEAELLRKQFKEISELYQEDMDARELLAIYITLLEKVFAAKPHAKILYVLHGEADSISRDALNKSLGFEPAVILRAIHELQNANLVEFDDHQNIVSLKKRLYK